MAQRVGVITSLIRIRCGTRGFTTAFDSSCSIHLSFIHNSISPFPYLPTWIFCSISTLLPQLLFTSRSNDCDARGASIRARRLGPGSFLPRSVSGFLLHRPFTDSLFLQRVALPDDHVVDCSPRPVLLISASDTILEPDEILNQIQRFPKADDVFEDGFISDVLLIADDFAGNDQRLLLLTELAESPVLNGKHWHLNSVYGLETSTSRATIPSGPYFLGGKAVFQAWKLYTDELSCFQTTVLPTEIPYMLAFHGFKRRHGRLLTDISFKNLNAISPNGTGMSVAVPSRLYARPSTVKPLAGVRVGVKDNFRLAGTKSAVGNRSFLATYDVDEETAAFVKTLIDLGAVIVGKTKMTAFASGEKPCDWFDFQCPFNPRGDSYLEPGASSTGSAAATAAYPWIDICIGTDSMCLILNTNLPQQD